MKFRARTPLRAIALLGLVWLSACAEPEPPSGERDEAGVYTAVLREYVVNAGRVGPELAWDYLLVADHSAWSAPAPEDGEAPRRMSDSYAESSELLRERFFMLRRDCLDDFMAQESVPKPLPPIELDFPLRWLPQIPPEERRAFFWEGFEAEHPGNIFITHFSPIGFDPSGDQALLTVTASCGSLCSSSDFVLLERGAQGWHIVARFTYGVS
ncbi:MAG: hypothetical protein DHS20C15_19350 [Planctomycetota bacterium]|nr:MAG: hypothetical protein DHS20C15_19350 [Planctomycetota bacterium]